MKNRIIAIFVTFIIVLLPIIAGILLWDRLPDEMVTHWNASGEADGYSSKGFAVFVLPLILAGAHLVCSAVTFIDPKNRNISGKMLGLVLWICPFVSILCNTLVYSHALGYEFNVGFVMCLFIGILFAVLGNYLPKCRHNYTVGIKTPWTLASEDNWNKTHRMAGPLWLVGGIVIAATSFLANIWIFFGVLMVMAILPMIYSYMYYVKNEKEK